MKAIILLGTLKRTEMSNTETLSDFLVHRFHKKNIQCEIIKLVNHTILPGTYSNMGPGDEWPELLTKITDSDIIIFATPIWWGNYSSEIQRIIERLDALHDEILAGKKSRLTGKAGGIVITGDSDGAQHIIAGIANFFNAIGIGLSPFASLSVVWENHKKGSKTTREELLIKYQEDYKTTADKMIEQLITYVDINKNK